MEKAVQPLAAEEASGPSGAKAYSLPTPSSSSPALPEPSTAKKDKEKKFSRFAKKKWKEMEGGGVAKATWKEKVVFVYNQSELFITSFFKYYLVRNNINIVV